MCRGMDACVHLSASEYYGRLELSWYSPYCRNFAISGIGRVYFMSSGSGLVPLPTTRTDYTISCLDCGSCSYTLTVYPLEGGGITTSDTYNCNQEFADYSFVIENHGEVNYWLNDCYDNGMQINRMKVMAIADENDDDFEPHCVSDWREVGELGHPLPAEYGYEYEIRFSSTSCDRMDEHYYAVRYSYNDVLNAPASLTGYIVNNHQGEP